MGGLLTRRGNRVKPDASEQAYFCPAGVVHG